MVVTTAMDLMTGTLASKDLILFCMKTHYSGLIFSSSITYIYITNCTFAVLISFIYNQLYIYAKTVFMNDCTLILQFMVYSFDVT